MDSNRKAIEHLLASRNRLPRRDFAVTVGRSLSTGRRVTIDLKQFSAYIVGQTGSGKTNLLGQFAVENPDHGKLIIDPMGKLSSEILLPNLDPDQTIYYAPADPAQLAAPLVFNPLDPGRDELSLFELNELAEGIFNVFRHLYVDAYDIPVPIMEMVIRASTHLLVRHKGTTFLDFIRVIHDASYRNQLVQAVEDEVLRDFWLKKFKPSMVDSSYNKFFAFVLQDVIRKTLCHPRSSFYLHQIMAQGKTLVADLGGLPEAAKDLIGGLLISQFLSELNRRERQKTEDLVPFGIVCDEFDRYAQANQMWEIIFSKIRQQNASAVVAHQHVGQVSSTLLPALLQAAYIIAFQVDPFTAQTLRKFFPDKDIPAGLSYDPVKVQWHHTWLRAVQGRVGKESLIDLVRTFRASAGDPDRNEMHRANSRTLARATQENEDETQTLQPAGRKRETGARTDGLSWLHDARSVVFFDFSK